MGADMAPTLNCNHETPYIAKTLLGGGHSNNPLDENLIAHSLRGEGFDASEDGTGRGTPLVPVACDVYNGQVTGDVAATLGAHTGSSANHAGPTVAVPTYTLAIRGRGDSHNLEYRTDGTANALLTPNGGRGGIGVGAVAFSSKDHGADAGDISPTLRSMGHDGSHANGGGQVAVAFGGQMSVPQVDDNLSQTLQRKKPQAVMTAMQVRRLTPRECERLQGFPDDYTLIPLRNKKPSDVLKFSADGPRYKALGNSWAVPCARWIGERIEAVEAIQAARKVAA